MGREKLPVRFYKNEARKKFFDWLALPVEYRDPKTRVALAKKLGISVPTTYIWEKAQGNGHVDIENLTIEEKIKIFDKMLFDLIQNPKTPSKDRELFAKRYGLIMDKTLNIEVKVDADEYTRLRNEARRELEAEGFLDKGAGKVRPEPLILPK